MILEVGEVDLSTASGEGGNSDGNSDSGVNNDSSGTADSAGNSDSGGNGDSGGSSNSSGETIEEEIEDEIIDEIIGGNDFEHDSNQDGDSTGEGGGSIDFEEGVLEDVVVEKGIWTKKDLIEVVKRGLLPRNVDGAGQTLSVYNNLLANTVFERSPMRQFAEIDHVLEDVVVPEPEVVPEAEPVRGLWSKNGELNEEQAGNYLAEKTSHEPLVLADGQGSVELMGDELLVEIDGTTYLEDDSLTNEYAGRDGVRGWFRGFGGSSADSNGESGTIFNPYTITASGGILGVDVSLSESFQIGAYANYGNISLSQRNGVEDLGGGWNADGWGGGVTADYWTQNFYIQGLLGATGFSGEQRRHISGYGSLFDNQTATGDKNATSMVGALRLGAPFQSGSTFIEPQLTATWSGNHEHRFSESADNDRLGLTYKSRNTNYLQTALGVKFAWPVKSGDTSLFIPSLKLAWLADWDKVNDGQTIGLNFTDKTYNVGSNQEDVNGALIEAGLDYSLLNLKGTTVKGYLRGGAEVWGGNRGTNWRASGGVTFQF
ncbi:autotransporter outer membrane beta-barrel domain-containing protein [Synechococcus sp. AH-551-E02]|nr:autotransporter outer membrane beta-barrel domain-containing protein [Synechococcus sp. AH-551-E02]MDB4653876.1 autotransporter outer membrane beta-barrel domain-containing protein [Synechococcus sp. AH-551-E02]